MPRLDTKLEAEGAEFLVLGQLLLQRISAYKTYTNMPGYDIVATNPETNRSARIQVKSRWRTGAPFFLIKTEKNKSKKDILNCDFVVAVRLNRGKKGGGGHVGLPDYFILPKKIVLKLVRDPGTTWSKMVFRDIENLDKYKDNWSLIAEFLANTV